MKPYYFFFLLLPLLCACGNLGAPDSLLTPEEIVPILRDIHIVDAGVDKTNTPLMKRKKQRAALYDEVLVKHDINRETFYNSYQFYIEHPVLMDSIYSRVIDSLNAVLTIEQSRQKAITPPPSTPKNPKI